MDMFINVDSPLETRFLSMRVQPAASHLQIFQVKFEMVKASKIALSECIPFCFKEGILEIEKLNLKAHLLCVCMYHRKEDLF